MGFVIPALKYAAPWIAKGAGALVGGLFGKKREQAVTAGAQQRSPEEQAALGGASGAAGELGATGAALTGAGQRTRAPATSYYSTLLRGNRGAMAQATAAPAAAIRDLYSGAERGLERGGRTSTTQAKAELAREQAGRLASLVTGVQPAAAEALTEIGQTQTGQGLGATGSAGSLYGGLLGQGAQNRQLAGMVGRNAGEDFSNKIGSFLFDILTGLKKKKSQSISSLHPF